LLPHQVRSAFQLSIRAPSSRMKPKANQSNAFHGSDTLHGFYLPKTKTTNLPYIGHGAGALDQQDIAGLDLTRGTDDSDELNCQKRLKITSKNLLRPKKKTVRYSRVPP